MRRTWPRRVRLAVAAVSLAAATIAFADLSGRLASAYAAGQTGPALLRVFAAFSWGALAAVAASLLSAFLFGRFYCSAFCPLGILQDLIGWGAGFFVKRQPAPVPDYRRLRYAVAALAFGALAGGWAIGFKALDPFTRYGAAASVTVAPAYTAAFNAAFPDRAMAPPPVTAAGLAAGLAPMVLLIGLVVWRRRLFCTALCPVGTALGLCAARGAVRLRLDEGCVSCGRCARVCPSGCIDPQAKTLDNERCVRCMNCLAACSRDAVRFDAVRPECSAAAPASVPPAPRPVEAPSGPVRGDAAVAARRHFLRDGLALATVTAGAFAGGRAFAARAEAASRRPSNADDPADKTPNDEAGPIYPPGAGTAARFEARCTGCHLCVAHCSGKVLRAGTPGRSAVRLDFNEGMCEFTCGQCLKVCPTGALRPVTEAQKRRLRIGLAVFFQEICVAVVEERDCGACAEHCPTGALRMREYKPGVRIPVLTPELCIGCGNCQYPCPVQPYRAIQVRPVAEQTEAEDPEDYFRRNPPPELPPPPPSGGEWLI